MLKALRSLQGKRGKGASVDQMRRKELDREIIALTTEVERDVMYMQMAPTRRRILTWALSTLPFQAEGHRHCVELFINFGKSFVHPTHGGGWRSDIAVALEATCCSIHAWFDSRYEMDPRVSAPRARQ